MAVFLGLLVALTYGTGDFFGGIGATRSRATAVMVTSFTVSLACLVAVTIGWALVGGLPAATGHDLAVGAAAGLIGPVAVGLLYRGLAAGRMSVVAPITAVVAAIVPFAWGLLEGERPAALAVLGVAVALVAVALISGAPAHPAQEAADTADRVLDDRVLDDRPDAPMGGRALVLLALASGLGFGVVFILFGAAGDDAGLWPLVSARAVAVTVSTVALVAWSRRRSVPVGPALLPVRASLPAVASAGVLDIAANAIYLAATQRGLLSIVAVLSSLYPASTVLLARLVLGERLHRIQVAGLVLAVAGVTAMAAA